MPDGERYQTYDERAQAAAREAGYDPNDPGFISAIQNAVANVQGHVSASAESRREAERLARGAQFRDGAPMSNADYMGHDHKQLKSFVTDNMDPGQVGEMSQPWTSLANAMQEFADNLNTAVNQSKAVWQGEAAEQAHGFSANMSSWSEETGQGAQLVSDRMTTQSQSASTAKNSMPEPIEFSWGDEIGGWFTSPKPLVFSVSESFQKQEDSQQAHEEAVRVMNTYDSSLSDSASKTPAFSKPPTLSGDSGGVGGTGEIGGRSSGTPGVGGSGGMGGSTGAAGYSGGTGGAPSVNTPGTGPGSPGYMAPGSQSGVGAVPGTTAAAGYDAGQFGPGGRRSGFGPGGAGSGGGAGGMGAMPFGPMGGAGAGGAGSGSGGGGGFGPRGTGAGGPGGPGAGGRVSGAGPMGGATAAGAAGAKPGGMGAGGRGAGGMMGGAGGGKGQGGEDKEHKDSYFMKQEFEVGLTETDEHGEKMIDPETGLPVVPPVIGG